jgi:tetratricopeptide (TPR) repeat protein
MAVGGPSITLRVFLASPGDVPDERAFVHEFLESILPKNPLLPGRVAFDVVSWDDPHANTTMPAHMTPQEAVVHYKGRPSNCDIVIVIVAARIGTHLAVDTFKKPDGSAYVSGTEWEYDDAWNATSRPDILVYRQMDVAPIDMRDAGSRREKLRQYELVEQFFERFKNPDGSWKGGFQGYEGVDAFKAKLTNDMSNLVLGRLRKAVPPPEPSPDTAPVIPPVRCFGRDADVAALVAALTAPEPAALLVLGPAGIGKTTLTRRVATDAVVVARFAARRWFVELETANDAATLQTAILQAIGLDPAATTFAAALAWLARQPCLLVLDNLETPWERDQRAVQNMLQMLAATLGVSLLASLRGGAAPPSPRWTRSPTNLRPLPEDEARRLFLELAPGIAADDPHLARFLTALGGVPLAVELVALRAAGDGSLRELWNEWQRRGVVLAAHTDLPPDHRLTSLARSLDLSWQSPRLRDEGRHLFRLLGQLPAGIAEVDRTALLGNAAAEAARQLRAVGLAFDRDGRLDLLPPVRGYAEATQPPEPEELDRACRHFLALVQTLGDKAGQGESGMLIARLAAEVPNLDAAFTAALTPDRRSAAVGASYGYYVLAISTGLGTTASLQALADASHGCGDVQGEAYCIQRLGDIALARSQHDAARAAFEQALPLYRQVGAVLGEANCIQRLGEIAQARSQHDAARAAYEQALPLYRQVGDVLGEANCIKGLGDIARRRSQHDAARAAYEQALPLYRQVGNVVGEANCILAKGDVALAQDDHDTAREQFADALALYDGIHHTGNIALAHERLARVTADAERTRHVAAARAAWSAMDLPDQVTRLDREFG